MHCRFVVSADVSSSDLGQMQVEITVLDRDRLRSDVPLGKVRIGPNQENGCGHWEEMVKHHGSVVKITHALTDA